LTQRKDGPFPYKRPVPDSHPLLTALARNPRPLIMMSVGLIGMLALVLFNTWGGEKSESTSPVPVATAPAVTPPPAPAPVVPNPASVTSPVPEAVAIDPTAVTPATPTIQPPQGVTAEIAGPELQPSVPAQATSGSGIATSPYIVLILDDIGNNAELGRRAVALPGAITYAVLPHTPHAASLAEQAHSLGKEVMLHAPMSNQAHFPLGPGALTDELSRGEFMQTLTDSIASIPHLQGVNNHMGSALTEQETQMSWVMEALREHDLYFVDSLTTPRSVAGRVAREQQIPTITRNVFLDNETTFENIDREFKRLLALAEKNGSAVGIGHPYIQTLEYLEQALPALAQKNIELVPVSHMLARQKTELNAEPKQEPGQTITPTGAW